MFSPDLQNLCYMVAAVLFVLGLKMLKKSRTARSGNLLSSVGMLIAIVTALLSRQIISWQWVLLGLAAGSLIGAVAARLVAMTAMPEMVALFNGFGGLASLLVSWSEFEKINAAGGVLEVPQVKLLVIGITVLIGGVTFTGSMVAWGKLAGVLPTKPLLYRGQKFVNALVLLVLVALILILGPLNAPAAGSGFLPVPFPIILLAVIALAGVLGVLSVIPIGGGDMPVVISLLNSYSGMAACAAGFVIGNNVLIVSGALVGASGIILTNIMCKAMNRSLANVLFSGFGSVSGGKAGAQDRGEAKPVSAEDAFLILESARRVVFVPGYGMAVAQAQHVLQELALLLEANGTEVDYAIHPVAGRMPGHMNVLLAEAKVEYDKLREMDDINPSLPMTDVALIVGANDVVNPSARTDSSSPIYKMPVINADYAKTVIVLKRSLSPGFAGIDNPLFYNENTRMLFGDAKASLQRLVAGFKDGEA